jgi:hypothetical protein
MENNSKRAALLIFRPLVFPALGFPGYWFSGVGFPGAPSLRFVQGRVFVSIRKVVIPPVRRSHEEKARPLGRSAWLQYLRLIR